MLIPEITKSYIQSTNNIGTYAQVYIVVKDSETNLPPSYIFNLVVHFTENLNGDKLQRTAYVTSPKTLIYEGLLRDENYFATWFIDDYTSQPVTPPQTVCNLSINTVYIDKPESAPGAADAKITIKATSDYEMEYSIDDGDNWQSSPTFSGLSGGLLTVKVNDSNPIGCVKETSVTIPVITSILTNEPVVNTGSGNLSRWSAAFNPVVFTYQRRDLEVIQITYFNVVNKPKIVQLKVNGNVSGIKVNDLVYVNTTLYKGVFKIKSTGTGTLVIDTPYIDDEDDNNHTGYVNSNSIRPYYKILTKIISQHPDTGLTQTIISTNRPDSTGLVKADISNFLQSLLQVKDNSDYTKPNFRDNNLSASYEVYYAEDWDGKYSENEEPVYTKIADPYYVVYAAKQLGDAYGGNLAAYIPFKNGTPAQWITDFAEPAYSNNYPFDISFIYSEHLLGRQLYYEFTMLDINRQPLAGGQQNVYLLNENASWLLKQDTGKFLINRQVTGNTNLPEQIGLNRLLINYDFPDEAYYVKLAIKYDDNDDVTHTITQTQTIRIDKAGDNASVYLRWIGLTGSWNYYRFFYNQEVSLDVQNAVIIKNYVTDWENQQGIEEVVSKSAGQKIKVIAEDLPVADIKGLQSIKYSPKVQMLVNKNPVKWQTVVVNTATYSEYETRNGQAPFSITFNLPAINIQSQ